MRWIYPVAGLACLLVAGSAAWLLWPEPDGTRQATGPAGAVVGLPGGGAAEAVSEGAGKGDAGRGARLFRQCAACHTIGQGAPDLEGPNLYGVVGAPVAGSRTRYGYSQALRSVGGTWDTARLDDWLRNPRAFAPGTRMAFPGVAAAQDRADLIAYLGTRGPPSGPADREGAPR